ncbi:MAG: TIGR00730 family Rossman fold protein [Alphaproteobacteria bacterium]|nr:TIGR00730 family Rossman fold protein [Alphaproteobacteria bacterium]
MTTAIKSVAVYCGHEFGNDPQFTRDAARIGELLARNKIKLIFGGGNVGLMGTVCNAALDNGGAVLGVSTTHIAALQEPTHTEIELRMKDSINERKTEMFNESDAFIILPGGLGTLNELSDIMTMQQIGETKKPLFFLNTHGFWNPFSRLFVHMQNCGFIEDVHSYNISGAATPDELIRKILKHNA